MNVTNKSFNPIERLSFSAARDPSKTMYATPFILKPERGNRYKVDPVVV